VPPLPPVSERKGRSCRWHPVWLVVWTGTPTCMSQRRDGTVEQMRVLMIARTSARMQRNQTLNQLRQIVITGPDDIRARFKDRYKTGLISEAARMRSRRCSRSRSPPGVPRSRSPRRGSRSRRNPHSRLCDDGPERQKTWSFHHGRPASIALAGSSRGSVVAISVAVVLVSAGDVVSAPLAAHAVAAILTARVSDTAARCERYRIPFTDTGLIRRAPNR